MLHVEIVKAIIIFASGIISGVVPKLVYDWWNRPQISIIDIDEAGSYHSIFVKNSGRSTAINCESMLTLSKSDIDLQRDIPKDKTGPTITSKFFREIKDMNLSWARMANGNLHSISIYPGARQLLNFYKAEKPNLDINISSEKGWDPPRIILKSHKEYNGEIKIFAENVKYKPKKHKKKFIIFRAKDNDVKFKFID